MGNKLSHCISKAITAVKSTINTLIRRIAPPIMQYIIVHPIRSTLHLLSFTLCLIPGVIIGPLLARAGFTGSGIAAGSLASAVQSVMVVVPARGGFAVLQSAAMGGYGVVAVMRTVRGSVIAAEAVGAAVRRGRD